MTKNKALKFTLSLFVLAILIIYICLSQKYVQTTLNGIKLFCLVILPSLFPALFLTTLLTKLNTLPKACKLFAPLTKKAFNVSYYGTYAILLSMLSGYPIGASITCDLYCKNYITKTEAKTLSILASTSGPAFIIGVVGGGLLNNIKSGVIIFASHIIATIFCGIIFKNKKQNFNFNKLNKKEEANILNDSMYSTINSILMVGGFITLFYLLINMLIDFKILNLLIYPLNLIIHNLTLTQSIIYGFFECTYALTTLSSVNSFFVLPVASFIVSIGGLSIIIQSAIYLNKVGVKIKYFLLKKLIQGILAFFVCIIISLII